MAPRHLTLITPVQQKTSQLFCEAVKCAACLIGSPAKTGKFESCQ